jgi:hypothetical protein
MGYAADGTMQLCDVFAGGMTADVCKLVIRKPEDGMTAGGIYNS